MWFLLCLNGQGSTISIQALTIFKILLRSDTLFNYHMREM